jgi:hypothetical protein
MKRTPTVGPPKRANIRQLALGDDDQGSMDTKTNVGDDMFGDVFLAEVEDEDQDGNDTDLGSSLLL